MNVFVKTTPYLICIGDNVEPGRLMVEIVDVEPGTNIDDVLSREVLYYLGHDDETMDRAVFEAGEVSILKIHEGPKGERGPFAGDWLVAKIAPAVRAVADARQLVLPLQLAS